MKHNDKKKYKKAIEEYGSFVDDYQKVKAYGIMSGVFYHAQKYKEAYLYLDKYIELNEHILGLEKQKEFEKIRTQYEVEKKDNQITLLETEKELAATRKKWIIISAILLAIPLIGLFLFYRHRAKTQHTIRLQEKELHDKEKEKLHFDSISP